MEYSIGSSVSRDPQQCVNEATAKFQNPKLILFFSQVEGFEEYTKLIHEKFPKSVCMGATAIAAFSKSGADKQGLKAMAFESELPVPRM